MRQYIKVNKNLLIKTDNNKDNKEGKDKENVVDAEVVDSKEDKEKRA